MRMKFACSGSPSLWRSTLCSSSAQAGFRPEFKRQAAPILEGSGGPRCGSREGWRSPQAQFGSSRASCTRQNSSRRAHPMVKAASSLLSGRDRVFSLMGSPLLKRPQRPRQLRKQAADDHPPRHVLMPRSARAGPQPHKSGTKGTIQVATGSRCSSSRSRRSAAGFASRAWKMSR